MIVRTRWVLATLLAVILAAPSVILRAQVGKSQGVVDANTASEQISRRCRT